MPRQGKASDKSGIRSRSNSLSTRGNKNKDTEVWKCGVCKNVFASDEAEIIQCEYCQCYYCKECLELSTEECEGFQHPSLHWFCASCEERVMKNIRTDREVEQRCSEFLMAMKNRIVNLETDMKSKLDENQVRDVIKEYVEERGNSEQGLLPKVGDSEIETKINEKVMEIRQSSDREKNLIIYGMEESTVKESAKRKEADTAVVHALADFIETEKSHVVNVVRIGKVSDVAADDDSEKRKPRPVKVTMTDANSKKHFLKQLPKLRDASPSNAFRKMSVTHDMTKEEREANRKLQILAREKNTEASGDEKFVVRGPPWDRRVVRLRNNKK